MNRSKVRWLLVVSGVLLWVLAVYPGYYVVHKPLDSGNLKALVKIAGDLVTWMVMVAVATALGTRLTRRLAYHSLLERLTFSAGLGLILFSMLTLVLGLAGLLYGWFFWLLLTVAGIILLPEFRILGHALRQVTWPRPRGTWHVFLSLFVAGTLLFALLTTLLPPTAWDSLVYHLVGPRRYLQAHRLTLDFDNYYLFFPSFTEMLFTMGMGLKSDVVSKLLHFSYLLLTVGGLGAFAARYWQRHLGLVAAALFLSIPTAVQIATWSYVDLTLTFYTFAALYALLNGLHLESGKRPTLGWLILAGLFAGVAPASKYTGVVSLLILGGVLIWALLRRNLTAQHFLRSGLILAGCALVVAAPWYIKNVIVTGNPLYPLIWGGREWNEIATRWLLVPGQKMSALDLFAIPWTLTVIGTQGSVAYDATYSPLFLTLLPLLLVVRRRATGLSALLMAATIGYAFWILSGAAAYGTFILRGRQILPIFAPLSLLCAYSLEGLSIWDHSTFSLTRLLTMVIALTLALGFLSQILLTVSLNPWPYLTGMQSRNEYLDQYTSQHLNQTFIYLNENLSSSDKVLFIWEPRSYGCHIPHKADVVFDNFSQRLAQDGTPEKVLAGLEQEGFTHILVNAYVYPWIISDFPITPQEQAGWEAFRARYLTADTMIHKEGEYLELYRLPSGL